MSLKSAHLPHQLKVQFSLRSPFARRVRIALRRWNIAHQEVENNVFEPTPEFYALNPLGQVPVLCDERLGVTVPDSTVILEYLHEQFGQKIWPLSPVERAQVREAATWATGIMTYTVSSFLEKLRSLPIPADQNDWRQECHEVIERTLARIASMELSQSPWMIDGQPTQAYWDLAVALEYLALRLPEIQWAEQYPALASMVVDSRNQPVFAETAPPQ